jgi:hypothetical protein
MDKEIKGGMLQGRYKTAKAILKGLKKTIIPNYILNTKIGEGCFYYLRAEGWNDEQIYELKIKAYRLLSEFNKGIKGFKTEAEINELKEMFLSQFTEAEKPIIKKYLSFYYVIDKNILYNWNSEIYRKIKKDIP